MSEPFHRCTERPSKDAQPAIRSCGEGVHLRDKLADFTLGTCHNGLLLPRHCRGMQQGIECRLHKRRSEAVGS